MKVIMSCYPNSNMSHYWTFNKKMVYRFKITTKYTCNISLPTSFKQIVSSQNTSFEFNSLSKYASSCMKLQPAVFD